MAVSQHRKNPPPGSPPKAKRAKKLKKQENQLVCIEPKKTTSNKTKNSKSVHRLYDNRSSATLERANEVQASLLPEFPSFVKHMLHSHVIHGFWLGLPKRFCVAHMPEEDTMISLEDEDGNEWPVKYLAVKVGLSGGWKGFSVDHKLVEGDVAVFQLVSRFKFKVFIVRLNGSDEVDCALGLLELEAHNEQVDTGEGKESLKSLLDADPDPDDDDPKDYDGILDQSDKDSGNMSPEVSDGLRLSDSIVAFEEVRSVEDFEISANGLVINSEISKCFQGKYYELCRSQRKFLHEDLLEGLNCKLIAGIISETVNIADAIRASKITTPPSDLSVWAKTLMAFEALGMNIGFLRSRLDRLLNMASESERYENVEAEKDSMEEELRVLEAKFSEAKERVTRLNAEFETLRANRQELELAFKEVASAPW